MLLVFFTLLVFLVFKLIVGNGKIVLGYLVIGIVWTTNLISNTLKGALVISDELFYLEKELFFDFPSRFIWLLLNKLAQLDVGDPIITMKVVNLIIAWGFFTFLVKKLKAFSPYLLAGMTIYLGVLASYNFRDILIVWFTFLIVFSLQENTANRVPFIFRTRFEFKTIILFLCLTLLRPLQAFTLVLANIRIKYLILGAVVLLITFSILASYLKPYFYTLFWRIENIDVYIEDKIEQKGVSYSGFSLKSVIEWFLRFIFAPIPTSLLSRMFSETLTYQFGAIDELYRFFHRTFLYLMFIYIGAVAITNKSRFVRCIKMNATMLSFVFMYSLTYAIFNFGGSHERIKFTVFVATLVVVNSLVKEKNENSKLLYKD